MSRSKRLTKVGKILGALCLIALLFSIPAPEAAISAAPDGAAPFSWNRDAFWKELESRFVAAENETCDSINSTVASLVTALDTGVAALRRTTTAPNSSILDSLERQYFELGPLVARCGDRVPDYARLQASLRDAVKAQSQRWDLTTWPARERIYRALYGSRGALEEVLLHHSRAIGPVLSGREEPSATPSAVIEGVRIHSGDLLVSRGGYPTSALIARGSDFPGNFSHVALVHVDSSGVASTIEAHIASGVSISTAQQYLEDKKRRILVLRPRADLPALVRDPMLPHRAASAMLERTRTEHIPYDFTMDYGDPSRLFCSEVASSAYRETGITLWTGLSTISAQGLRRWLSAFGVEHFETQEPSDLEYDPQLVVVAEWRDLESLAADHIDNAVIDAMLEGAERGDELHYELYRLPVARLAKGYSWVKNRFGGIGPIPEGMAAGAALRNQAFSSRQRALADEVTARADEFERERGYPPPYWALLDLARAAVSNEK